MPLVPPAAGQVHALPGVYGNTGWRRTQHYPSSVLNGCRACELYGAEQLIEGGGSMLPLHEPGKARYTEGRQQHRHEERGQKLEEGKGAQFCEGLGHAASIGAGSAFAVRGWLAELRDLQRSGGRCERLGRLLQLELLQPIAKGAEGYAQLFGRGGFVPACLFQRAVDQLALDGFEKLFE